MSLTGRSRKSTQQALVMGALVESILLFGSNPVFQAVQLGGMVVDVIDPYGYGETLTRESVDEYSGEIVDSIHTALTEGKEKLRENLNQRTSVPSEDVNHAVNVATAPYRIHYIEPSDFHACFGDYNTPEPSLSGPPTKECDPEYTGLYRHFIDLNRSRYQQEHITEGNKLINSLNQVQYALIEEKVKKTHNEHVIVLIVFGVLFISVLLFGFFLAK